MIVPLALAQFIASYAATNMNVAIGAIAKDLGSTVSGVQTAITLFTLTMAALMIPGSKLTDIWGRKRCFVLGLAVYAVGGLLAALSRGLPLLIGGYSLLEGVGSALMIPPIYILVTVTFPDVKSRARYFGVVSGAGGLGAAAGPLIGGLVTSAISWRASFGLQILVVALIIVLARKITDPARPGPVPRFDLTGAVLSAAGLFFVVLGLLQSRTYGFARSRQDFTVGGTVLIPKGSVSPVWLYVAVGALFLLWFFLHVRSSEKKGKDVLLPLRLFRDKVASLGLGTQTIQWLILQGSFFVVSVYLQEVNGYSPIQTGLLLTPATIGILAASAAAGRLARRHPQRWLIIAGFLVAAAGLVLLLVLVRAHAGIWRWIPGLLLFGAGVGTMLTSSVNVVQSSFPEQDQGEISGLSRSVSNLGSSLGTALVGSVLVAVKLPAGRPFAVALAMMLVFALIGLVLAVLIPRSRRPSRPSVQVEQHEVLEQDHHDPQAGRDRSGEAERPAPQLGGPPGQPAVHRQQDDHRDQRDVGRGELGGPGQVGQHQGEQRQERRGDHRPGTGQRAPDAGPAGELPPFDLLAEHLRVLLGDPVHQQRDHDRDHQGDRGHVAADGVQDRGRHDGAVDAGRAPAPEVLRGRPAPDLPARRGACHVCPPGLPSPDQSPAVRRPAAPLSAHRFKPRAPLDHPAWVKSPGARGGSMSSTTNGRPGWHRRRQGTPAKEEDRCPQRHGGSRVPRGPTRRSSGSSSLTRRISSTWWMSR